MAHTEQTDILVAGGGVAGVAAAVAAARSGLKVTLLEKNAFMGGKATAAEVGTVCGLYTFSRNTPANYVARGFCREFAEALQQASGMEPLHNAEGLHYLPYDTAAFKDVCHRIMAENNVNVYTNTVIDSVTAVNEEITGVGYGYGGSAGRILAKAFVDCTGDAAISRHAGIPTLKSPSYQAAAQVFSMENVDEDNEMRLGFIVMKSLMQATGAERLPEHYNRLYIIQGSLKGGCVHFKTGIPLNVTGKPGNLEALRAAAEEKVRTITDYLRENVPAFSKASLQRIAPEVGIRVGERATGRYLLTVTDVLECRKFDDAVANGSWPIEEWEQHRRVKMRYFSLEDHYQVPARCLRSNSMENLFMAGRNISATDEAVASARVMGTCLQTGFAAGWLAAGKAMQANEQDIIRIIQETQL